MALSFTRTSCGLLLWCCYKLCPCSAGRFPAVKWNLHGQQIVHIYASFTPTLTTHILERISQENYLSHQTVFTNRLLDLCDLDLSDMVRDIRPTVSWEGAHVHRSHAEFISSCVYTILESSQLPSGEDCSRIINSLCAPSIWLCLQGDDSCSDCVLSIFIGGNSEEDLLLEGLFQQLENPPALTVVGQISTDPQPCVRLPGVRVFLLQQENYVSVEQQTAMFPFIHNPLKYNDIIDSRMKITVRVHSRALMYHGDEVRALGGLGVVLFPV